MSHRFDASSDESLMVAVNAEIDRLHRSLALADSEFFCECGDVACKERVALGRLEFTELRRQSRAVLAPWHRYRDLTPGAEVVQLRSNVIQLESAIANRAQIELAKELLAERGEMTLEDAFESLRRRARRERRSVGDICAAYILSVGEPENVPSSLDASRAREHDGT